MDGKLRNMTSVFLTYGDEVLCLYRIGSRVANNQYIGSAGGHFEKDELNDARCCALREMHEELGLGEDDVEDMRLRYVTLRLKNGEIRQNYYFFARLKERRDLESTEGILKWFPVEALPKLDMPASARHMIAHYVKEGRFTDEVYGGVAEENGARFVPFREF